MGRADLELADWRRQVSELYGAVRADPHPPAAHARWRRERQRLFAEHPQSPLRLDDPLRETGPAYFDYDPAWRFSLEIVPVDGARLRIPTGGDEVTVLRRIGRVEVPDPVGAPLDVWWLEQYAGGIWLPVRDGSSGTETYGGGRYVLDTAKGADLGSRPGDVGSIVVDFNFAYHPSCRYNPEWECPLAPVGNTVAAPIRAGERL